VDLADDPSLADGAGEEAARRPTLRALADELRAAAGARFQLLELEAQRAAWSAAKMMGLAVAAALLVVTAWLVFAAALTAAAVAIGLPWWLGALLVIGLHLLAAWLLAKRIQVHVAHISFAATRRSLSRTRHVPTP
jgi:hypothetical protein